MSETTWFWTRHAVFLLRVALCSDYPQAPGEHGEGFLTRGGSPCGGALCLPAKTPFTTQSAPWQRGRGGRLGGSGGSKGTGDEEAEVLAHMSSKFI